RAFVLQTLEQKVDDAVDGNAPENAHPGDWDLEEMLNELEPIFPIKSETSVSDLEKKDREEIRRLLKDRAIAAYEAKEQEVTPEIMRLVEQRYLLLPIIDRMWVDHLAIMDHLKTGIGLRGYGQIDPRVEYEKEAYEIFEDLKTNIADEAGLDSVMPFRNASARWSPLNLRQNSHNVAMRWGGASERRHPLVAWI
ncbi:MAG: hypothetical protein ACYDDQ_08155, partial [Vulcanimicrobiaceae bacterium]